MMIQVSSKHSPTDQSNWREVETKFKSLDASILGINAKLDDMADYDFSGMVTQIEKNRVSVTHFLTTLEGVENISLRRDCSRYMYNDTWFNVRNNAGSGNIDIFKVDTSDNIRLGCNVYADDWDGTNSNLLLGVGVAGAGNLSGATASLILGYQAGYNITSADYSMILGANAGYSLTIGGSNTALGYEAGYYNQSGLGNVYIGYRAGRGASGQSHDYNIFIGNQSGYKITTGDYNFCAGYQSGYSLTSGSYNVIIGYRAGDALTTKSNAVYIGPYAGGSITTGGNNTFLGFQTGLYNQIGSSNTLVGYQSGFGSGSFNSFNHDTYIGERAGYSTTTGGLNVFLGSKTGYSTTSGSSAVALGCEAGYTQTTVSGGIYIGYQSGYYETVGSKLYITNQKGSNEADGRAKALLYGVMSATTANQTLLINAVVTFAYFPITPSAAPTTDYQVANKKYVDDNAGGGGGFDTDFAGSMSGDQTIATSTLTKLSIDTAGRDNNSEFDAVNDRFKSKALGTYVFAYGVRFAANATGYRNISLRVNAGATYYGGVQILPVSATVECNTQGSYSLRLAVDDYVEAYIYQNSGGNLDAKSHNASFISVHRIN